MSRFIITILFTLFIMVLTASAQTEYPEQFYRIGVRLNPSYKILPTPENIIKTYEQSS